MPIEIRVIDPKNTDPGELKNAIRFIAACAGLTVAIGDDDSTSVELRISKTDLLKGAQDAAGRIASEDNPSAGLDAASIFAGKPGPVALDTAAVGTSPTALAGPTGTSTGPIVPSPNAAAPAPSAAPVVPGTANPVVLDSAGLPWDGRIHAETKTTIADGTWRKKRGVDANLVASVEAELRQALGAPAASVPTVPAVPVVPVVPVVPNAGTPAVPLNPIPSGVSAVAQAGGNEVGAAPVIQPTAMTFPILMGKITSAMAANTLTDDKIKEVLRSLGLPETLPSLVTRTDMIPTVAMMLFGSPNP